MIRMKSGSDVRVIYGTRRSQQGASSSSQELHDTEPLALSELLQAIHRHTSALTTDQYLTIDVMVWQRGGVPIAHIEWQEGHTFTGYVRDHQTGATVSYTDRDSWLAAVKARLAPLASEGENLAAAVADLTKRVSALEAAKSGKEVAA